MESILWFTWLDPDEPASSLGPDRGGLLGKRLEKAALEADSNPAWRAWLLGRAWKALCFELEFANRGRAVLESTDQVGYIRVGLPRAPCLSESADCLSFEVIVALEGVLSRLGERALEGVPTDLGRTPGEVGHHGVGHAQSALRIGNVKVHEPPEPMALDEFWTVIDDAASRRGFRVRLRGRKLESFVMRAHILVEAWGSEEHQAIAESLLGPLPGDAWEDLKGWVLAQGRDFYTSSRSDLESFRASIAGMSTADEIAIGQLVLYPPE